LHSLDFIIKNVRPSLLYFLQAEQTKSPWFAKMLNGLKNQRRLWVSYVILTSVFTLQEELASGEDIAKCPSCSLLIKVIYDIVSNILGHLR
jgi:hypothetical protein